MLFPFQLTTEGELKVVLTIRNVSTDAFNTYTIEGANDIASGQSKVLLAGKLSIVYFISRRYFCFCVVAQCSSDGVRNYKS